MSSLSIFPLSECKCGQKVHLVKAAMVRLSIALGWKQLRSKIWIKETTLNSDFSCIVCAKALSELRMRTRKGEVSLISITLRDATTKALRRIEA